MIAVLKTLFNIVSPCKVCKHLPSINCDHGLDHIWQIQCVTNGCPVRTFSLDLDERSALYSWNKLQRWDKKELI